MNEIIKAVMAFSYVVANTLIQWLSDADTALKFVATIIAIPTGYFAMRFMYYQQKAKKLEMKKLERDLNNGT